MVNGIEQDKADHKAYGHLNGKLISSPDADAFFISELFVVIPKTDEAECQCTQQSNPDIWIGQVGPEKGWDDNGSQDKTSSHGGRSIFNHVPGRDILPHHLLNLKNPQLFDQPRPDDKTDEKSG
jgi:hypothetical protein